MVFRSPSRNRHRFAAACGAAVFLLAGSGAGVRADDGSRPEPAASQEVRLVRNQVYRPLYPGEKAADEKNRLDLYLPRERQGFPVLFFVHGGAWRQGSKDFLGMYSALGLFWAHHGVGVVVPNYRLSPGVKHPEHIKDVARAFAWTVKNIARYGGRPDALFVSGHSAGGHLAALLATDARYLKAEGLSLDAIKGVIAISGVYRIYGRYLDAGLAMEGPRSWWSGYVPGQPRFSAVFGSDPKTRRDASPLNHVKAGLPPFLLLYADGDLPTLPDMAREFTAALKAKHCQVEALEVKHRNHMMVLLNATQEGDPAEQAMMQFLRKHAASGG